MGKKADSVSHYKADGHLSLWPCRLPRPLNYRPDLAPSKGQSGLVWLNVFNAELSGWDRDRRRWGMWETAHRKKKDLLLTQRVRARTEGRRGMEVQEEERTQRK